MEHALACVSRYVYVAPMRPKPKAERRVAQMYIPPGSGGQYCGSALQARMRRLGLGPVSVPAGLGGARGVSGPPGSGGQSSGCALQARMREVDLQGSVSVAAGSGGARRVSGPLGSRGQSRGCALQARMGEVDLQMALGAQVFVPGRGCPDLKAKGVAAASRGANRVSGAPTPGSGCLSSGCASVQALTSCYS